MSPIVRQRMRSRAAERVAEGFDGGDTIVRQLVEEFGEDEPAAILRREATRLTAEALDAHWRAQKAWPIPTDCDRLDRAFAALDREGVVARQNFSCCQTCGHVEISDEIDPAAEGYVFYHEQDTEAAAGGHGLYLAYGSADGTAESAVTVAERVVRALEREGLRPSWDGTLRSRIFVPIDWKRRRAS